MRLAKFSKYISYLFIPPVMNLLIFIIFSIQYETFPKNMYGIIISFIFGLGLPLIAIFQFRKKGILSDNDATIKEERQIPYLFAIGFSLSALIVSSFLELDSKIIMLWLIYLVNSIIILNINRYWKISAHTMGAAMPVGALVFIQMTSLLYLFLLILVIIGFARVQLKVHTFLQVLLGSIVGFSVSFVLLKYCL